MFKPFNSIVIILLLVARASSALVEDASDSGEAAQQFKRMEERLAKATSLKCALRIEFEGTGEPGGPLRKGRLTGSLALAEGNRARFELKKAGTEADEPGIPHWLTICDGQRGLHQDSGMPKPHIDKAGTEDARAEYAVVLARSGLLLITYPLPPVEARDIKDRFPASEFKLGPQEKVGDVTALRIDYRFDVKGQKQPNGADAPFRASVWLDPKTSLPLKRTITWKLADVQVIAITETYDLVVDQKIDPGTFQLPQG